MRYCGTFLVVGFSALVVFGLPGCYSTQIIRQSGIVPHPRAPARSGQNISGGRAQFYHHSSVLTHVDSSRSGTSNATANRISGYMGGGGVRFRMGDNWDIGPYFEVGSNRWTHSVTRNMPDGPSVNSPFAFGLDVSYSVPINDWVRLAFAVENTLYFMPNQEYRASSCTEEEYFRDCGDGKLDWNGGIGAAFSVIPSFKVSEWLALFAGMDLRVTPRFTDIIVVETEGLQTREHEPVNYSGNVSFGMGAAFRFADALNLILSIYQPVVRRSVAFGPVVGFVFSIDVGPPVRKPAVMPVDKPYHIRPDPHETEYHPDDSLPPPAPPSPGPPPPPPPSSPESDDHLI